MTQGIDCLVLHFRTLFQGIRVPVDYILNGFQHLLLGMPASIAIGAIGAWSQAMVTLALVLAAVGGVGIVILAIILDRLTQSLGRDHRSKSIGSWYAHSPVGLLTRPFIKKREFFAAAGVRPRRATVLTLKTEEKLCAPQRSGR